MDEDAEQVLTRPYEPWQPRSNSRKTAYPELTGEVAMVGAPLDTTRADREVRLRLWIAQECYGASSDRRAGRNP
ncbi:hypothetical protein SHKM778_14510 [Streptomyces sp. KM77-8]|uniref:Transposase n=1 Tax=Streptomyces haneummycinicus TaxID=3074435 RepID=A0AAT9HC98_9ACTN